jgi:chromosomal replication initiator protein
LQAPDFETRIAIIQKKIQSEGISIDYDVIEYIAHSVNSNVRELEGVIVSSDGAGITDASGDRCGTG